MRLFHRVLLTCVWLAIVMTVNAQSDNPSTCELGIAFYSDRYFEAGFYWMNADGGDIQQLITLDEIMPDREFRSFSPSPDGTQLAVAIYRLGCVDILDK